MKRLSVMLILAVFVVSMGCGGAKMGGAVKTPDKTATAEDSAIKMKEKAAGEDYTTTVKPAAPAEKKKDGKVAVKREAAPAASGLKAGFADDNRQFNYFIHFLQTYRDQAQHLPVSIDERIMLRVKDKDNKSLANAKIAVYDKKTLLCAGKTYADGTFLFFPSEYGARPSQYRVEITIRQKTKELIIDRQGPREIPVVFDVSREVTKNVPLDIVFILDTTGSMGEEINRLKSTIEIINLNLASLSTKPKIRFGMVLYKDLDDEYVTKVIPLTEKLDTFQDELAKVNASGGGDEPENLQAALHDTIKNLKWNRDGIRLCYIITDAPPHLDYEQSYTYVNAVRDARNEGIKIFSVGTGGLNISGEYVLRQIAQYTYAKYIFLTYGEKGESEGGKEGSVSHHTGANFQTDKLESIIIRFAKEELGFLTDQPLEQGEEYIQATKIEDEKNEETLKKLFDMAATQLIDYSSIGIAQGTPASIAPFAASDKPLVSNAEYFTEQMTFSLSRNKAFKMVERKDLQKILKELEIQSTGLVEDANAVKLGKFIGARLIITGKLYVKDSSYEIFLKMLRVETGDVLSVNKLKIDKKLGLGK